MGGRLTWCSKVKNMLFQYGFGYAWVANEVGNEKVLLAKSIYYKEYITLLDAERYLSIDMCYKFKRTLSHFRCSRHSLMVELGRHQYIDREYRYCPICIKNDIHVLEDEMHCLYKAFLSSFV